MPDARGHVLDYRSAVPGVEAHDRYSRAAIAPVILSVLVALPFLYLPFAHVLFQSFPLWLVLGVPVAVLIFNVTATFHLLRSPNYILGDGLMAAGVSISGAVCLLAGSAILLMRI